MIPIGTDQLRTRPPVATIALILINVAVHFIAWPAQDEAFVPLAMATMTLCSVEAEIEAEYLPNDTRRLDWAPFSCGEPSRAQRAFWRDWRIGDVSDLDIDQLARWQAADSARSAAVEALPYWRWGMRRGQTNPAAYITHAFLHFGFFHLLGNMVFLWSLGSIVEESWGARRFLLLYFVGTLASNIPALLGINWDRYSAGASGAVAAVMGAFLLRHFKSRIRVFMFAPMGIFHVAAWWVLPAWFLLELASFLNPAPLSNVGHGAHVAGFLSGVLFALVFMGTAAGRREVAAERGGSDDLRRKRLHLEAAARAQDRRQPAEHRRELEAASQADPDDLALAVSILGLRLAAGERDALTEDTAALLRRTWMKSDHGTYLEAFRIAREVRGQGALPPLVLLRAAVALEPSDLPRAAGLLHEAAQGDDADPATGQALRRYANALDKLGDAEGAASVRQLVAERGSGTPKG